MSTLRRRPSTSEQEQPRGPNGERLCYQCGKPVTPPKRSFCGKACVHEWRLRTQPGYLRAQVFKRDEGICAKCGRDAKALEHELIHLYWHDRQRLTQRASELGLKPELPPTLWHADHITPVIEGGGECDLTNMRTLCLWCHREETAALHRRRRKGKGA